jgi:predicted nucleic acid-binding protein
LPFVLDASVTASWHFPDESNVRADRVLQAIIQDVALVPTLWWFEIRDVMLLGERRRRTTGQQTTEFLTWISGLPIRLMPLPYENGVMELARRHRLTFYDAMYLELAEREGIALATFDAELVAAARAEGVALVG